MDLQQAFDEGFDALKGYVDRTFEVFAKRFDAMEQRLAAQPVPKDGKDADVDEIAALAAAALLPDIMEVRAIVEALPAPVELPDIPAMIEDAKEEIKTSHAWMKVRMDGLAEAIDNLAALPPAEKGKDADPVEVAAQIAAEVERAVATLPAAKDGQSVTIDDVRPLIDEAVTKAVTLIPVPKDGVDGKDGRDGLDVVKFIRDDKGHLNGILRDGTTVDLGEYVGKDGAPGERGKDGADAVGFDDMDLVETDQGVFLRFTRGEVVKDFRLPVVTDRGVFKEGTEYRKGDGVTWGGSFWIAQDTTSEKPDIGKGWRLSVKRGRDGKDGIMKDPPKPGPVKVG